MIHHRITLDAAKFSTLVSGNICQADSETQILLDDIGWDVMINAIFTVALGTLPDRMQDMTEPQLSDHLGRQLRFVQNCETSDTIGSMLVIFQDDGITQYGATVMREDAPAALRELADRLENNTTVKRT